MSSTYVRRFNLKGSLSDKQVGDFWKLLLGELEPAIQKVKGVKSCKIYSEPVRSVQTSGWLQKWIMPAFMKPCCVNPPSANNLVHSMGLWT